jgi:excisionase family DNA binding protein
MRTFARMTTHAIEAAEASTTAVAPRYYTAAQVAVILNLGKRTVYELIASGELTAVPMGIRGGTLRIPVDVLEAYERKIRGL